MAVEAISTNSVKLAAFGTFPAYVHFVFGLKFGFKIGLDCKFDIPVLINESLANEPTPSPPTDTSYHRNRTHPHRRITANTTDIPISTGRNPVNSTENKSLLIGDGANIWCSPTIQLY
jgi:hypothetical protein